MRGEREGLIVEMVSAVRLFSYTGDAILVDISRAFNLGILRMRS